MAESAAFDDAVAAPPDFDHTDPVGAQDLYAALADVRERCPVVRGSRHGGFWALTRYADVTSAAMDYQRFTTRFGVTVPALGLPAPSVPLMTDPPQHQVYRRALQPFFTINAVDAHAATIRRVVVDRIESFAARGRADLMREFAGPVPCIVIALILGLDPSRWSDFNDWVDAMEAASHVGDRATRDAYAARLQALLETEVDRRKAQPRGDLLSTIAHLPIPDDEMPDAIRYGMAQLILVAGHDTTVNGIGNTLHRLLERPDLRARVLDEPHLLDLVIEESLRFESPLLGLARTVTAETSIDQTTLCPGDKVLLMYGSANHDARQYPEPESFDPERTDRPPHVAFGWGRHRCIGEHLARLEMRIALEELVRRIPDYRLAPGEHVQMRTALVRGPKTLNVVWDVPT